MSYKRNSKSRIARLMLALTLMGSVGQRITNNVSAMRGQETVISINNNTNNNVFSKQNYGIHELDFDLAAPVKNGKLTDDAKKFGRLLTCNPVLESGRVDKNGKFKRDKAYDVQSVKDSVLRSFVSNYTKFVDGINDKCGESSFGAMYKVIATNVAKKELFDFTFSDVKDSKQNDAVFSLLLAVIGGIGGSFDKKAASVEGYRNFLKNFVNGITGHEQVESSLSALIVSEGGARLLAAEDVSSLGEDDKVIYSNAAFVDIDEKLLAIDAEISNGILQTLNGFVDEGQGNFVSIGDDLYLISNNAADDDGISLLGTLAAIRVYSNSGNINDAVEEYKSIAKSPLKDKGKDLLNNSYAALHSWSKDTFPEEEKEGAINFVLNVKDAYSKNIEQEVNRNDFLESFDEARDEEDIFKRVVGMVSSVFPNIFQATQIMEHPAYGAFLRHVLVGSGVDEKGNPGGTKGNKKGFKTGGDEPGDGAGEKKGLSTGAKVAMGITIPVAVLVAAGVLAWKTGYGAKIWGKIKTLTNPDGKKRSDIKFNSQGKEPVVKN